MSLRKLYYALPASWRLYVRQIIYWPEDAIQRLVSDPGELIPPKRLTYTGRGDFLKTGIKFNSLALEHKALHSTSSVFDIGCGIGRMAIPLTNILSPEGSYYGFDLMKPGIDWCTKEITKRFPNFKFECFDLKNNLYRENGRLAKDFVFPADDNSIDLIFSISVFTHMLEEGMLNYLKESQRIMKVKGTLIASFFVMEDEWTKTKHAKARFKFKHKRGNYFLMDPNLPEANVAYQKSWLEKQFSNHQLKILKYFQGDWKGMDGECLDFQDVYLLQKI